MSVEACGSAETGTSGGAGAIAQTRHWRSAPTLSTSAHDTRGAPRPWPIDPDWAPAWLLEWQRHHADVRECVDGGAYLAHPFPATTVADPFADVVGRPLAHPTSIRTGQLCRLVFRSADMGHDRPGADDDNC